MFPTLVRGALCASALLALPAGASAHVTLERTTAIPDTPYRGVLQVNHGCGGAATTALAVTLPDGVIGVRPMPKPGWSLAIRRERLASPYRLYGELITEAPREITWSGGALPDDQYDEFVFTARVAADQPAGGTLAFPVVQNCGETVSRWVERAAAGQPERGLKWPAPLVRIVDRTELAQAGGAGGHDMAGHHMSAIGGGGGPATSGGPAVKAGALTIEQPWMRATPSGAKVAGGYVRITNTGTEPDRLIGTAIPLAGHGEVHEMKMEGDVMKMRPVDGGIEIAPGQTVELKPGGLHLMFMDLRAGAKEGDAVRGSLTFARAGTVEVTFQVAGIGARAPAPEPKRP